MVISEVAREMDLRIGDVLSTSTFVEYVEARRRIARRLSIAGWNPRRIGGALNRDRSTIVSLLRERT